MQSAAPCMFMVTDYSAEISFSRNSAQLGVGHHMYGTSARDSKCNYKHINIYMADKQGKPYCRKRGPYHGHVNISFDPGLNEILSPVSSAPWRVCLCDSNGKTQCASFSQIFTDVSIYRGETFTLSACVVGYDFGTAIGIVHAKFRYSNSFSRLENHSIISQ